MKQMNLLMFIDGTLNLEPLRFRWELWVFFNLEGRKSKERDFLPLPAFVFLLWEG